MVAGVGMMYMIDNGEKLRAQAYGGAGGIATECLFSMRTMVALGIEERFHGHYRAAFAKVRRVTIVNQSCFMCSVGMTLSAYLVMVAVAVMYGTASSAFAGVTVGNRMYRDHLRMPTQEFTVYSASFTRETRWLTNGRACSPGRR